MNMVFRNMVLQYACEDERNPPKRIRIIWIDALYKFAYFVDLNLESSSMPKMVETRKLEDDINDGFLLEIADPYLITISENEIPLEYKKARDTAWEVIEFIWNEEEPEVLSKIYRSKCIKQASEKFGITELKVMRIISRFWQRGMIKNALLPDYFNSGGKGKKRQAGEKKRGRPKKVLLGGEVVEGINVDSKIEKIMQKAIDLYYRKNKKITLAETYRKMKEEFFSDKYNENGQLKVEVWDNDRIPSYMQFYNYYKSTQDFAKDFISRNGQNAYDLSMRPLLGSSTVEVFGPGARYEVDATAADVYLVSSLNRNRVIGRPVVYGVIDVYSRMVTGVHVALEGPSWRGALMALNNVVADKVEFCKKYGINIKPENWPNSYLPECILADNGEFEGYNPENLINNLGVKVENAAVKRGDMKPIIERRFKTINEKIRHNLPGAVQKEYRQRYGKDYREEATLDLMEFTAIILCEVIAHNNRVIEGYKREKGMMTAEIPPIPTEIWNWGMKNRKGRFSQKPDEVIKLNLLYSGSAGISREGIKFKNIFYTCDVAIEEQWFVKRTKRSVGIVYDPADMRYIYIPTNRGNSFIKGYMLDKSYAYKDMLLEEIVFQQELESEILNENVDKVTQIVADYDVKIKQIVNEANEKSGKYQTGSKKDKVKNIDENRAIEREFIRKQEAIELDKKEVIHAKITSLEYVNELEEQDSKKSRLELLKRKRDELRGR